MSKYKQILTATVTVLTVATLIITIWEFAVKHSKKNYSGEWNMTSEVETARLTTFVGMKLNWVMRITQSDDKLTGYAEKISINNNPLNFRDRTRLTFEGSLDGDRFFLNFIEKGKLRETSGTFTGEFMDDKFSGTFSSSASDTKGHITGFKSK